MKVRIHRAATEIGGNCIELESQGVRIVLDVGLPLGAPLDAQGLLPDVPGLADGDDPSLAGVVISHPHLDHYGLMTTASPKVPVYIGPAARRVIDAAAFFTNGRTLSEPAGYLCHRRPFDLGPFCVTPYLNDHSAFDAYSLLVEAGGRRLFYTGDFRAHGRKASLFEELLRDPPASVDVLLMEGTHVRADGGHDRRGPTEQGVEERCVDIAQATRGAVLALYSPQNVDRLVTLYRAARRSGRDLVMDLYAASIAAATGCASIPQAGWDHVRMYLPRSQRARVVRERAFHLTETVRARRIYADELAARRGELVVTFRASMMNELNEAGIFNGAHAVWSMWPGYLSTSQGIALQETLGRAGVPLTTCHASGHAHVNDLQRLASALAPERIVPIHCEAANSFRRFFRRAAPQCNGALWDA